MSTSKKNNDIILDPLTPYDFIKDIKTIGPIDSEKYLSYFKPVIDSIFNFTLGPYFWLIPDNFLGKIVHVSPNIHEVSCLSKEEWLFPKDPAMMFADTMFPEDREFIFASIKMAMELATNAFLNNESTKATIYARFKGNNQEYKWFLLQMPSFYFNDDGVCHSILAVYTDLGHLDLNIHPQMTIVIKNGTSENHYRAFPHDNSIKQFSVPKITKREKEILQLIIKGLSGPEIAAKLFISYYTVENHKRNLREKTNTKTVAELINYVVSMHLM